MNRAHAGAFAFLLSTQFYREVLKGEFRVECAQCTIPLSNRLKQKTPVKTAARSPPPQHPEGGTRGARTVLRRETQKNEERAADGHREAKADESSSATETMTQLNVAGAGAASGVGRTTKLRFNQNLMITPGKPVATNALLSALKVRTGVHAVALRAEFDRRVAFWRGGVCRPRSRI